MIDKDIFGGLVRLHVLYHASHEDVFGLGLIEELTHHGYKVSPGTLTCHESSGCQFSTAQTQPSFSSMRSPLLKKDSLSSPV